MQILTDTHMHTVASHHAYSTVHDYWQFAAERGLQLFGVTDHAPDMPDGAHGWHFGNMKVLPRVHNNIAMLRAIEANIQPEDGGLGLPEGMYPFLDYIIASFHEPVFPPADRATHTRAVINTLKSGRCQILGHPGNPNYPIDYEEVVRAAKDNNVLIEINNSSFTHSRLGSEPNCLHILELVDRLDWKVSFGSDSHTAFTLGHFDACIARAEQIGFPEERVVTANAPRFLAFLAEHDKPVATELQDWARQFGQH
ncbi:phosphatase [Natronospirillum operosum]|uniref:Phosphatase n=1 Tax=Natronospirillum operosum TaxID=2759953 RepID=A0A4Z0WGA9_9GAMM|nr:phosphatase [Natronospirillum operosum]TGG94221.1 phosphatase [Natronospirillum operosum]